jgi:putative FmdB family regulatory protein
MPTYDYACPDCGGFEAFRSMAARNDDVECPSCGTASTRVFVSAPRLALVDGDTRRAIEINERAQYAPKKSGELGSKSHPAGCGCCSTGKRGATVTAPNGNKAFPTKRPWMISH